MGVQQTRQHAKIDLTRLGWFLGLGRLGWVINFFLIAGKVGFGS